MVLRAGFAGSRRLISGAEWDSSERVAVEAGTRVVPGERAASLEERGRLEKSLNGVLVTLGDELVRILSQFQVPAEQKERPRVSRFFAEQPPLLRMVTGLCEGADALAAKVLDSVSIAPCGAPNSLADTRCLETELAAVLPFDVESYRRSRPVWFRDEFDKQLGQCAWVLQLDGIYDKPDETAASEIPAGLEGSRKALANNRRAKGYRAQGAFVLRHSDILIAAGNPDTPARAGGTLETVREALAFNLPVVFIHTGRDGDNVWLIGPEEELNLVLADSPPTGMEWQAKLTRWVKQIVAGPDSDADSSNDVHDLSRQHGDELLAEYFDDPESPPRDADGNRKVGYRERIWTWFERCFRKGPDFREDPALEPFARFRRRARDLNYHYSGQYRGAFLLNYALAIGAVFLAAVSLTLLGTSSHTPLGTRMTRILEAAGHLPKDMAVSPSPIPWLLPALLSLAAVKLGIVVFISRNTRRANKLRWNERAVDYRYLAERLRGMYYLPLAGCHQPPAVEPHRFALRDVRQSAVDWLFESLVRSVSPADMPHAKSCMFPANREHHGLTVRKLLTIDPPGALIQVRDSWIAEQARYHERTSRTMHALHEATEKIAMVLGWGVVVVVIFDLALIGGKVFHLLPDSWVPFARSATPWLIFVSAVLPAIVAALGGVRFQSECKRLAERSAVMRIVLTGRPNAPGGRRQQATALKNQIREWRSQPAIDPGSWSHNALRLIEHIATDFVHEAAEWSVLYAREVADPG